MARRLGLGLLFAVIVTVLSGGCLVLRPPPAVKAPPPRDPVALAQCLRERHYLVYGAWWCGHCDDQKKIFGVAGLPALNYTECYPDKGTDETPECQAMKFAKFPTWVLPDGRRISHFLTLDQLAALSGCPWPAPSR